MKDHEIVWNSWNREHVAGHGGSPDMAESVIRDPDTLWRPESRPHWRGLGTFIGRSWTIIVAADDLTVFPITMYPTKRGGIKHRRSPK